MKMSIRPLNLTAFFLTFLFHPLPAQIIPLHTYTVKDGLPSNLITTLYQDSKGFLWVGTNNGLCVYDGSVFANYSTANGLTNNWITGIAESRVRKGRMWVSTIAGGLNWLDNGRWSSIDIDTAKGTSGFVANIVEDHYGNLWCTSRYTVFVLAQSELRRLSIVPEGKAPVKIIVTPDSLVWVATSKHLYRYTQFSEPPKEVMLSLPDKVTISTLAVAFGGSVWLGLSDSSLLRISGLEIVDRSRLPVGVPLQVVQHNNLAWVRTLDNIASFTEVRPTRYELLAYSNEPGAPRTDFPILVDREDNLWIGSWSRGLHKLADRSFTKFPIVPFDSAAVTANAIQDGNGHVWVGSRGGLWEVFRTDNGGWKAELHPITKGVLCDPWLIDDFGCMIVVSRDGEWVQRLKMTGRTLGQSRLMHLNTYERGKHYPSGTIVRIYVDRDENIWIAVAPSGIVVLDSRKGKIIRELLPSEAFPVRHVTALYHDGEDRIWIGTFNAGLYLIDPIRGAILGSYHKGNGLPANEIRSLFRDEKGKLWIGTRYNGLVLKTHEGFRNLSMTEGLIGNGVWAMQADRKGRLWLHTDVGIVGVDADRFTPLPIKQELMQQGINGFGIYEGEFLWVKNPEGLTFMDFSRESFNLTSPLVSIKGVEAGGELFSPDNVVELPYDRNTVSIGYVGISLRNEKGVRYRYRMLGLDTTWSSPSAQRSVTFATLHPGNYTFEVKATNADGVASLEPASVAITVIPPFWERWWFVVLMMILFTGSVAAVARYFSIQKLQRRVQQLEREQAIVEERTRTRERIATDLHDDVASSLSSIALYTESLKRQVSGDDNTRNLLHKISTLSLEAEDAVGDIVWSVAPEHDTLQELAVRMRDFGSDLCGAQGMEFDFNLNIPEQSVRLSDALRKNIYLIFKEAMHNVIKHARAQSVSVAVQLRDSHLHVSIIDDGVGYNTQDSGGELHRGHGLRNMQKRAKSVGAALVVDSTPGSGTKISLDVRLT